MLRCSSAAAVLKFAEAWPSTTMRPGWRQQSRNMVAATSLCDGNSILRILRKKSWNSRLFSFDSSSRYLEANTEPLMFGSSRWRQNWWHRVEKNFISAWGKYFWAHFGPFELMGKANVNSILSESFWERLQVHQNIDCLRYSQLCWKTCKFQIGPLLWFSHFNKLKV